MKKFLFLAALFAAFACTPADSQNGGNNNGTEQPEVSYADFERVPLKSEIKNVQPMTGIVLWNTHSKVNTNNIQLEYSYMLYNDVCKEQGVYDWTPMDNLLEESLLEFL